MTLKHIITGISGILLLAACQDIPFFSKYYAVDTEGWDSRDTLVYSLPEVTSSADYDVTVSVRTIQSYKYDNLALVLRLYEGKKLVSVDTVKYDIYDMNGEHRGTGFPYVEHETALHHSFQLLPKKHYKVKATHIMRLDPLDGICNVGIEIK